MLEEILIMERLTAEKAAKILFTLELTVAVLEKNRTSHSLPGYNGDKPEKVEAFQMYYVNSCLAKKRRAVVSTTKFTEKEMRKYLRPFRLLYYSLRRLHFYLHACQDEKKQI
jgi:hypothetical protein